MTNKEKERQIDNQTKKHTKDGQADKKYKEKFTIH